MRVWKLPLFPETDLLQLATEHVKTESKTKQGKTELKITTLKMLKNVIR